MIQILRIASISALLAMCGGCAQLAYYSQAAQGQMAVLAQAKPIERVLVQANTDDNLKARLKLVQEIRRFAVTELGLPDNGSYKKYADLKRPYVLWNVVVTPELSLTPEQWCFLVVGCVSYRGYYNKELAYQFAETMQHKGLDVLVAGVPAYSTLGWFDDPVLSTFIHYSEAELARLIFHELAHQVIYIPGDTQFNESFATAVEEIGVTRWLNRIHNADQLKNFQLSQKRRLEFIALLSQYRLKLAENYASKESSSAKRLKKSEIFLSLKAAYSVVKHEQWNDDASYDTWFNQPLSNAHLALASTYFDLVPAFHQLWSKHQDFSRFYQAVRQLSKLEKQKRRSQLAQISTDPAVSAQENTVDTTAALQ